MVTVQDEMRKGPWTEQEDLQLALTEQARAAASGGSTTSTLASSTGACRHKRNTLLLSSMIDGVTGLIQPVLKQLSQILQVKHIYIPSLYRWSRIARRLPGRTDNEIKNYWRTHMRKKAQERKTDMSPSSSSSSFTYQSCLLETAPIIEMDRGSAHNGSTCISSVLKSNQSFIDGYSMDQIWKEIEAPAMVPTNDKVCSELPCPLLPSPPMRDRYCPEVVWNIYDDEIKMLAPQFGYGNGGGSLY
ncbi:unnamed protein product [Alopecurus aequalis]